MKITRIETIPVRVPIKPELAIRSGRGGAHLLSPFLIVKVHTDTGLVGIGEASCTPRWSGEDQVTASHFIHAYFAPLLVGEMVATDGLPVHGPASVALADIGHDAAHEIERLTTKFATAVAGNHFTKAAIEMALWDLLGKFLGQPAWQIAGNEVQRTAKPVWSHQLGQRDPPYPIPTKWSISGVEPTRAAEIAAWALACGFQAMKVKVGIEPATDLDRVLAVRRAVGPHVKLGVDANGGWPTPSVAIETIQRLCDDCEIYFAEQPVPPGDPDALAEVRRNIPVPVIADESIFSLDDARMLAQAEAADVLSIYVGKAGGIGPARQIAAFAQSVGLKCTIGSNLELGVGTAAMIHLALSAPGVDADSYPCDIIGPMFYEDDVLAEPLHISNGTASPHAMPGLGIELDDEKVEKYRVR